MGMFDNFNFSKLKEGLTKTRDKIVNTISETISGKAVIDEKTLEEIEEILISADIGSDTAARIIESTRKNLKSERNRTELNILDFVKKELISVFDFQNPNHEEEKINQNKPYIILIVGINGVGKTTTIGKLAHNYKKAGLKVIVGAADTFRAAANEQLEIWARRADVQIMQNKKGTDPSSVAYDTVQTAIKEKHDIVLIDTAGRLHNKSHLMDELSKIKRVINKVLPNAPNETFLVLDGNTGQNAIVQAKEFSKVTDLTGLIITKLDGTAKGGVVFQISSNQKIPVKYIGVGESIDDLQTFIPDQFVKAIFDL
jgi:fused signal recognition particle receptor